MAMPIAPTPILYDKKADAFIEDMLLNEDEPAYMIPTPKLDRLQERIHQNAQHQKRHY